MMNDNIIKYPRTPHIEGSRLQSGDEDLSQIPFSLIKGRHLVVEEKCDGANSAVSFNSDGEVLVQCRGHYLTGGYGEKHFNLMKQWASVQGERLYKVLGSRYVMYGEWMYAKHSVYYNALAHYFIEFDIYDRENGIYLDTASRRELIGELPVVSAPVLAEGEFYSMKDILKYLGHSNYITGNHIEQLAAESVKLGLNPELQCRQTDNSTDMEGLYIKVEENGRVVERVKYVRASFLQVVDTSDSHWQSRPIIPNRLCVPIDSLFGEKL